MCGGVKIPAVIAKQTGVTQSPADDIYAEAAKKVAGMPIWVFHGDADPTVPVTESQNMVAALKTLNADVKYTEYPGVKHNSWDNAYNEPDFPVWLFSQKLKVKVKTTE